MENIIQNFSNINNSDSESQQIIPYNISLIISKSESIEDKVKYCEYIRSILQEKKPDFLVSIYDLYGREFILKILEKTLETMNNGGMMKKRLENLNDLSDKRNIRTVGGTFINLIKESEVIPKDIFKKIFFKKTNTNLRNKRKKLNKLLESMTLDSTPIKLESETKGGFKKDNN